MKGHLCHSYKANIMVGIGQLLFRFTIAFQKELNYCVYHYKCYAPKVKVKIIMIQ